MVLLRAESADSLDEVLSLQRGLESEASLEVSEIGSLNKNIDKVKVHTVSQPSTPPLSIMLVILF